MNRKVFNFVLKSLVSVIFFSSFGRCVESIENARNAKNLKF